MPPEQLAHYTEEDQEIINDLDDLDRFVMEFGEHADTFLDLVRRVDDDYRYRDYFTKESGTMANSARILFDVFEMVLMDAGLIAQKGISVPRFVTRLVQKLFHTTPVDNQSTNSVFESRVYRISKEHGVSSERVRRLVELARDSLGLARPEHLQDGIQ